MELKENERIDDLEYETEIIAGSDVEKSYIGIILIVAGIAVLIVAFIIAPKKKKKKYKKR